MKNIFLTAGFVGIVCFLSCGGETEPVKKPVPAGMVEEGWVSDSQFRVKVSGDTDLASSDQDQLRKSSESAALKKARETVVKNFVATRMKTSSSAGSYAVAAISIEKDFRDTIENGKVLLKNFENENKRCIVVYQVEKKDLRRLVEEGKPQKK
jgi:hypothetical protein